MLQATSQQSASGLVQGLACSQVKQVRVITCSPLKSKSMNECVAQVAAVGSASAEIARWSFTGIHHPAIMFV
jgi:hypothetical protein